MGGIRVFYGCVNIGMPLEHFEAFQASVAEVARRPRRCGDRGSHVKLRYGSTALVLSREDFLPFCDTLARAAEVLATGPGQTVTLRLRSGQAIEAGRPILALCQILSNRLSCRHGHDEHFPA